MPPKRKSDAADHSSKPSSSAGPVTKTGSKSAATGDDYAKKSKLSNQEPGVTAKQFSDSAKPIEVSLGPSGQLSQLKAEPTTFSTGSYGWKASGKAKVTIKVDGQDKEVMVQVGCNLIVIGSKADKKPTNGKRGRPRKHPVEEVEVD